MSIPIDKNGYMADYLWKCRVSKVGAKVAGKGPASWSLPLKVLLKRHPAENVSGHLVCLRASHKGWGVFNAF